MALLLPLLLSSFSLLSQAARPLNQASGAVQPEADAVVAVPVPEPQAVPVAVPDHAKAVPAEPAAVLAAAASLQPGGSLVKEAQLANASTPPAALLQEQTANEPSIQRGLKVKAEPPTKGKKQESSSSSSSDSAAPNTGANGAAGGVQATNARVDKAFDESGKKKLGAGDGVSVDSERGSYDSQIEEKKKKGDILSEHDLGLRPTEDEIASHHLFTKTEAQAEPLDGAAGEIDNQIKRVDETIDRVNNHMDAYQKSVTGLQDTFGKLHKISVDMHNEVLTEFDKREAQRMCAFQNLRNQIEKKPQIDCDKYGTLDRPGDAAINDPNNAAPETTAGGGETQDATKKAVKEASEAGSD